MTMEDSVLHYLRGAGAEPYRREKASGQPFITISRQAGAGGRELAQALQSRMQARGEDPVFRGWHVFDSALCRKVAEDPKIRVSLQSLLSEEFRGSLTDYLSQLLAGESPQIAVHRSIFSTVRSLAAVGKAIIVGRAGACLTRATSPAGVHVRLVAPRPVRVHRMARRFGVSAEEGDRWVEEQDKARAQLVRVYFHRDIEDPLLYDLVINTDTVGVEAAADAVLDLVAHKVQERSAAHA